MFLDTVNPEFLNGNNVAARTVEPLYAPWLHFPYTGIAHHGTACCEAAREWFLAMDFAQLAGSSAMTGPRWIRARYEWGPSVHPIYWCEAVRQKGLDCGVLAAMATECYRARGVRAFPVQLVQRYSPDATKHWASKWADKGSNLHWIKEDIIYHEGCAVLTADNELRLWDASAAWWINPLHGAGYGSPLAVRIAVAGAQPDAVFHWGTHRIRPNHWHTL